MEKEPLLKDVIELHIHSSPDTQERKFTDIELAEEMKNAGARAVVLKSHSFPTAARAQIATSVTGFSVYGSITLNEEVGGFNPSAVETAAKLGAKTVWMPTKDAVNHRRYFGQTGGLFALSEGKVRQDLLKVLEKIAEYQMVLSMGHLSVEEQKEVARQAYEMGVRKIVIDHPELGIVNMDAETQKFMRQFGCYFLRCAVNLDLSRTYKTVMENLRELGTDDTILSTDCGNVGLPCYTVLMKEYLTYLREQGVSKFATDQMTKTNPRLLLDL